MTPDYVSYLSKKQEFLLRCETKCIFSHNFQNPSNPCQGILMPRLGLLTTKHQAVRAGYGVADDATGSEIAWAMISSPRILSARLAVQYWRSISAWQIPFRSFVSAIIYCISLFYCMCHTRCPCDTNVTRRVAGRVTHYYHTSHCEGVTSSTVRYLW